MLYMKNMKKGIINTQELKQAFQIKLDYNISNMNAFLLVLQ